MNNKNILLSLLVCVLCFLCVTACSTDTASQETAPPADNATTATSTDEVTKVPRGKKIFEELKQQSLADYGAEITIEQAVNAMFSSPSWDTGDNTFEEDGTYKIVLSGKDKSADTWTLNFYCNPNNTSEWEGELVQFNQFVNDASRNAADLLLRYLATQNVAYKEGYEQFYYCGNGADKLFDVYRFLDKSNSDSFYINFAPEAEKYLNEYNDLFPCNESNIPSELVNKEISVLDVKKNLDRYSDQFIILRNLIITQIFEESIGSEEYITKIYAYDEKGIFYYLLHCGALPNIYDGDVITAVALPVGMGYAENMIGGQTGLIFFASCDVVKSEDFYLIEDRLCSPEERYAEALMYANGVSSPNGKEDTSSNIAIDVNDEYYESVNLYLSSILGGDPVENGWVFEDEEYLWIDSEDDDYIYWGWAAGGGYGLLKQDKNFPSYVEEFDDGTLYNDYGYEYYGEASIILLKENLNIRTGPGTGYDKNGKYYKNTILPVFDIIESGGYTWYKVSNYTEQWVASDGTYVTEDDPFALALVDEYGAEDFALQELQCILCGVTPDDYVWYWNGGGGYGFWLQNKSNPYDILFDLEDVDVDEVIQEFVDNNYEPLIIT